MTQPRAKNRRSIHANPTKDIVEDADIYGNKVGSPDYRPWNDPDYGFKHHSTPPITRGVIAVFWSAIAGLACYGVWALVWI